MTFDQSLQLIGVLKWPALVLLLVIFVIIVYRRGFASIVAGLRNRTVSVGGAQLGAEQQQEAAQPALPDPAPTPAVPHAEVPRPPAAAGAQTPHLFEESDNPFITEIANSGEERDRWLYREGAKLAIQRDFERLYRTMFASQLEVLRAANGSMHWGGVTGDALRSAYDETAARFPDVYRTYAFEGWRAYMLNNSVLVQNGDRWAITNKGNLYLHFLVASGYAAANLVV
jgi:hypothetical protein